MLSEFAGHVCENGCKPGDEWADPQQKSRNAAAASTVIHIHRDGRDDERREVHGIRLGCTGSINRQMHV